VAGCVKVFRCAAVIRRGGKSAVGGFEASPGAPGYGDAPCRRLRAASAGGRV